MAFMGDNYLISNAAGMQLFNAVKNLPVVDPHNHANVKEIADNNCYSDAWQLFAATDHYVWEMMRKRGVPETLITGKNATPREKFLALAKVFPEIAGNPVYEWIHLDLKRYFGIEELLCEKNGEMIYDTVTAKLATDAYRPQALLAGPLNVEVMCSTDDLIDTLEDHDRANKAFGRTVIRPTWRPDKAMKIFAPGWRAYMDQVAARFNIKLNSITDLLDAVKMSHDYFEARGCRASDHGIEIPLRADYSIADADKVFKKAMAGEQLTVEEENCSSALSATSAKLFSTISDPMSAVTSAITISTTLRRCAVSSTASTAGSKSCSTASNSPIREPSPPSPVLSAKRLRSVLPGGFWILRSVCAVSWNTSVRRILSATLPVWSPTPASC